MNTSVFDLYEPILRNVLLGSSLGKTNAASTQERFRRVVVGKSARTTMLLQSQPKVCLTALRTLIDTELKAVNPKFHLVYVRLHLRNTPYLDVKWTILEDGTDDHDDDDDDEDDEDDTVKPAVHAASITQAITSFLSSKTSKVRKAWRQSRFHSKGRKVLERQLVVPEILRTRLLDLNLPVRNERKLEALLLSIRSFQGGRTPENIHITAEAHYDAALARQVLDIKVTQLRDIFVDEIQSILTLIRKQEVWANPTDSMDLAMGVLTFSMQVHLI